MALLVEHAARPHQSPSPPRKIESPSLTQNRSAVAAAVLLEAWICSCTQDCTGSAPFQAPPSCAAEAPAEAAPAEAAPAEALAEAALADFPAEAAPAEALAEAALADVLAEAAPAEAAEAPDAPPAKTAPHKPPPSSPPQLMMMLPMSAA